jgi:hypothetical protein
MAFLTPIPEGVEGLLVFKMSYEMKQLLFTDLNFPFRG